MTNKEFLTRISNLSPKRLALLALELQNKVDALQQQANTSTEPIAVISMACRFPGGANTPEAYWEMLQNGRDAVTDTPSSRFDVDTFFDPDPEAPGKIATRWGGYIDDIDLFDPQLFGIAPREAISMDPQQRMLLETSWETLERAGYAPDSLDGSLTGVFVGICNSDYYQLLMEGGHDQIDAYASTGVAHSIASGRISYVFGLQGPSVSVDTACSSSLVSLHLAVQSLRKGECRVALAGGVNALLSLETTIALSKARMMASDGRCKAFDASADGFVRSEGCGMVALKRLSDAETDGDQVLAVIRGSGMNQDGRSNGITAPNGPSQKAVIRAALTDAGADPGEVDYIETHGTGTSLGDPIEVQALGAIYGPAHSSDNPLRIGSVKTNIGHLESAAGIAGFIKLVLALHHGAIPPHLHLTERNPFIPWQDFPIEVPTTQTPWEGVNGRRLGGVSSFGFSGTNVHIIAENTLPQEKLTPVNERPLHLLTLSARTDSALRQLAGRFAHHLAEHPDLSLPDVAYTANVGRARLPHRLAISADDIETVQAALASFSSSETNRTIQHGHVSSGRRPPLVFLFTGQGAHYENMGRQLYETQPIFKAAIDKCDELSKPYLDQSILSILYPQTPASEKSQLTIDQSSPVTFAIEYALAQLWRSWGVEPDVVLGHSIGEYAAACIAGVFNLEDALKLVTARGRLMHTLPANGAMAAIFTGEAQTAAAIAACEVPVSIAGVNGPESTVISGEETAVHTVIAYLKQEKVRARPLAVSVGAHSPLMDPILDEFTRTAREVIYHTPQIEYVSTVTGQFVQQEIAQVDYWRNHLRQGVKFYPAMQTLFNSGYHHFLEAGPAPTLLGMGKRCNPPETAVWLPSLRPGQDDWAQMLASAGTLFVAGGDINWHRFDNLYPRQRLTLPTYPFQRERYWVDWPAPQPTAPNLQQSDNPLLGITLHSPALTNHVFQTQLRSDWPSFLAHHHVFDTVITPSPAYLEMALAAATAVWGERPLQVQNFTIHDALTLTGDWRTVQTILSPINDTTASFEIVSAADDQWRRHVTGTLTWREAEAWTTEKTVINVASIQARCPEEISRDDYYQQVSQLGLDFGPYFQGLDHIWRGEGEALGRVMLPAALNSEAAIYHIHPAMLDACFHLIGATLSQKLETPYLLVGMETFNLQRIPDNMLWNHTILRGQDKGAITADVILYNADGKLVAEAMGLHLTLATAEILHRGPTSYPKEWLYQVAWEPKALPVPSTNSALQLPAPESVAAAIRPRAGQLAMEHGLKIYHELFTDLDVASLHYIVNAMKEMGWSYQPGQRFSTAHALSGLGVVETHSRLFARLLTILSEEGILSNEDDQWQVKQMFPATQLPAWHSKYPQHDSEFQLLAQCGPNLAAVLQGEQEPLSLLFPDGSLDTTRRVYEETPFARVYNQLAADVVQAVALHSTKERPLRILEIGAGTGATTSALLPYLPPDQVTYTFTDLSPIFLAKAREKFTAYSYLQYKLLDIEQDPLSQDLSAGQFDLIVAANVLHATADLKQTLTYVKTLLVPSGQLMLLEGSNHQRWVDLTFGLTEGWWKFSDADLRPDYPLLAPAGWRSLLQDEGFTALATVPDQTTNPLLAQQSIYIAQGPDADTMPAALENRWLIFSDEQGVGQALAEKLATAGHTVTVAKKGNRFRQETEHLFQINPGRVDDYQQLLKTVFASKSNNGQQNIVHIWSLDAPTISDHLTDEQLATAAHTSVQSALLLAQATLSQPEAESKLWLVTQGAQTTKSVSNPLQAPIWGLGRVLALEHPAHYGGLIDLDSDASPSDNSLHLWHELNSAHVDDQSAWRSNTRFVPRLTRAQKPAGSPAPIAEDGAYLITGGLGGLGLKVAQWLAANGARTLVLTSRSGLPPRETWPTTEPDSELGRRITAVEQIEALDTTVHIAAVDVANREQMAQLIARFGQDLPPLRGVLHAAVAMTDWPIAEMPVDGLSEMMKSKVQGTWYLHILTQDQPLDFFVAFSSTTTLWGASNLGHYAAANQFMDALAHYRQAQNLPMTSINWGTWEVMRVASAADRAMVAQFGLQPMALNKALAALGDLLGQNQLPQITVADVNWQTLKAAYEAKRPKPFLANIQTDPPVIEHKEKAAPSLVQQIAGRNSVERQRLVMMRVKQAVANVLGIDATRLNDTGQGLFDMGMDSLMSVELKSELETAVGQSLPSTLTFNYPTIDDLTTYLTTEVLAKTDVPEPTQPSQLAVDNGSLETAVNEATDDLSEDELADLLIQRLENLD